MTDLKGKACFVIPHWRDENDITKTYLDETMDTVFNQTDSDWHCVIIDDVSPCKEAVDYLEEVKAKAPDKITIIKQEKNAGPGHCRNVGIRFAYENNADFIVFIDADDLSDLKRVEVARKVFNADADASVVYSTFKVIDENSKEVEWDNLSGSIQEIIEGHQGNPPAGINAWIEIGTEKGYTNLTSATCVRTDVAYKYPFPPEKVSEDSHCWMRYSAGGGKFVYNGEIPTMYRIPQNTAGSASRSREGGRRAFYETKIRVDTDGFVRAIEIALTNGKIKVEERDELMIKFSLKLGETMRREDQMDLALGQVTIAKDINADLTKSWVEKMGFAGWAMEAFK